jgi:hypothetical protein
MNGIFQERNTKFLSAGSGRKPLPAAFMHFLPDFVLFLA